MPASRLHISAWLDFPISGDAPEVRPGFAVLAAFPLAILVAAASLGGLLLPLYARETPSWAAQGIGQDWFDLVVAAPWLLVAAAYAIGGSPRWRLVLGGTLVYLVYTFVIYGFAVHFNAMFLVYCAVLGLSSFALAALAVELVRDGVPAWMAERAPVRTAGGFLVAVGVLFAGLWLSQVIPALARDGVPPTVAEAGLPTNPVHVLDLSIILPLQILAGVALLRRRPLGFVLAPILLGFNALMAMSIAIMLLVMHLRAAAGSLSVAGAMVVLSLGSGFLLVQLLRRRPE